MLESGRLVLGVQKASAPSDFSLAVADLDEDALSALAAKDMPVCACRPDTIVAISDSESNVTCSGYV